MFAADPSRTVCSESHAGGRNLDVALQAEPQLEGLPTTTLTGANSRRAAAVIRAQKAAVRGAGGSTRAHQRASGEQKSVWSCPDCGGEVLNHRHVRCDDCIEADRLQLAELRGRRGAAISAGRRAQSQWDEANPDQPMGDPAYYRKEILPRLGDVKLSDIVAATGFSKGYVSQIRSGRYTPHVSSWSALGHLAGFGNVQQSVQVDGTPPR